MNSSDYTDLITSRHSTRDFLPEPIADAVLAEILDDARHAPSWSNTRPYVLAVATGDRTQRLREAYVKAFNASLDLQHREPKAVVKGLLSPKGRPDADFKTWAPYPPELKERSREVGLGLYEHAGIARDDRDARDAAYRRNTEFFGAPVVMGVFVHDGLLPFSAHDAGLMLQTLMLSATAHGVASCPLGVLATWRHPFDGEFEIPEHYKLITGLALGYASGDHVNAFRASHPPVVLASARDGGAFGG